MSSWDGKSKSGTLGYRILVFILKNFGIPPTYFVLRFVAFHYFLFSRKSNKTLNEYFKFRLGWAKWKRIRSRYLNYYVFAQTLVDRVAIISGLGTNFTFDFDGEENLVELIENGRGGLLLGAHVGNWEIAGYLLKRLKTRINVVVYEGENQEIKKLLDNVKGSHGVNYIVMKNDMSHIYEIAAAIQSGELICMHADRYFPASQKIAIEFLGQEAYFPSGPFALSVGFKVPVTYVYAVKGSPFHYHLSSTRPKIYENQQDRNVAIQTAVEDFVKEAERILLKFPLQWFNYYDFWALESESK